jgi:hypothetical protein
MRLQPHYPKASIQQKQRNMLVLNILVDQQGKMKSAEYDAEVSTTTSASLIGAASSATFEWRFQPAIKDGKLAESYALVPIKFSPSEKPDDAPTSTGRSNSTSS